jgi:hypothetical protein
MVMNDLVERLRRRTLVHHGGESKYGWNLTEGDSELHVEAATEIEALRAAFRDLNSANDKLLDQNFALAAGQCANVTGDEGGTPQCAEIARLRDRLAKAEHWAKHAMLMRSSQNAELLRILRGEA